MAGHSQQPRVVAEGGRVQVAAGNVGQNIIDARPASPEPADLARLRARGGKAFAELQAATELWAERFRAELNGLAGGQAPASVMALATLAADTMTHQQAASILTGGHLGRISEAEIDAEIERYTDRYEKGARTSAGLAVVAKDLIVEALKQAKAAALSLPLPAANDNGSGPLGHMGIVASPIEGDE